MEEVDVLGRLCRVQLEAELLDQLLSFDGLPCFALDHDPEVVHILAISGNRHPLSLKVAVGSVGCEQQGREDRQHHDLQGQGRETSIVAG
jgi:hypothetical protein